MATLTAELEQEPSAGFSGIGDTLRLLVDSGFAADEENARFLLEMGVVRIDLLSDGDWLVRVCGRQTLVRGASNPRI